MFSPFSHFFIHPPFPPFPVSKTSRAASNRADSSPAPPADQATFLTEKYLATDIHTMAVSEIQESPLTCSMFEGIPETRNINPIALP